MTQSNPIIGIPCRGDISGASPRRPINAQYNAYIEAVIQAGGLPILIPLQVTGLLLETLFNQVDGLVFSGGGDIDPSYYRESPQVNNLGGIQKTRDELEIRLMQLAMKARKPFFAICRGIQVMNVANGGNLWQDLKHQRPGTISHDNEHHFPRNYLTHEVILDKSSLLNKILGTDHLPVNSLHHQGVKNISPFLQPTGYSEDGLVEVLEAFEHPFGLGVQWHPEDLVAEHQTARKIFYAFVEATRQNHSKNGRHR